MNADPPIQGDFLDEYPPEDPEAAYIMEVIRNTEQMRSNTKTYIDSQSLPPDVSYVEIPITEVL